MRRRYARAAGGGPQTEADMTQRRYTARLSAVLAAAALGLLVSGCRENEQNRPLDFQPGVYQGQKLPSLTEQQKRQLQDRGGMQK
jgi:hypothetical protein